MRWLVRLGIFLYSCLFAGKYICVEFFERSACLPEKQETNNASAMPLPAVRLDGPAAVRMTR